MKILAVDDDEIILALLGEALGAIGENAFELANCGEDALTKLGQAGPVFDCILLDIQMPGLDGTEVCRRIRAKPQYRKTPIIMLTAMSDRHHIEKAFAAGATDYVTKPFDIVELQARLRIAEQLSGQVEQIRQGQNSLDALASRVITRPAVPLDTPLEVDDVRGFLTYVSFRNFIAQLSRGRYYASSLVALKISDITALHQSCDERDFRHLIEDVADAVSENLRGDGSFFTYVGNGVFVCCADRVKSTLTEDFHELIEQTLFQSGSFFDDGQPREIIMLQGVTVNSGVFTGLGSLAIIDRAIESIEENAKVTKQDDEKQNEMVS